MASSSTSRALSRLSSRLQPIALKIGGNKKASSFPASISASTSQSAGKRSSWISRLPVELGGVETMLPLHSAIASARLTSSLSVESRTWALVPQELAWYDASLSPDNPSWVRVTTTSFWFGEMLQRESNSLAAENQDAETDEGTRFEKSLQELKDLSSHLHRAANYCEANFLNATEKRTVVENTKEYICNAVVTVVDHLGSVSANLECRLLKTNSVSEAQLRIDNLKQRLGAWEQYSHLLALRSHCWNADFPRYYSRYILPQNPDLQKSKILSPVAGKTTQFRTEEMPLFLYTHNCKPSLLNNLTSDKSSEKRKSFSSPVLPVHDGVSILPVVKDQHPNFHFQESPRLKRSMLNWKLAQNKDLRSLIRRGKRSLT
ncbi:hypothetical protein ACH5RR_004199 [Cinchona calisaya]|uniref:Protein ABIL5 n=1 Tax=Cinchona calisaya TaxID=153742 RepID=A0ABD3AX91_9GENT